MNDISITIRNGMLAVRTPFAFNYIPKGMPDRKWDPKEKVWLGPLTKVNVAYLQECVPPTRWAESARRAAELALAQTSDTKTKFPTYYDFGPAKPMAHQVRALDAWYGNKAFALFMEMGTGKTFTAIHMACNLYQEGKITQVLVICPVSIKDVWSREFGKFATEPIELRVVGTESLSAGGAYAATLRWVTDTTMVIIDESSKIKNYKAKRTTRAIEIAHRCSYRVILTGTPITQGLQDLFSQFCAIDPRIIGIKSFFPFRNRYCIMGGFEGRQIVGYRNVEELMANTRPYVFQITKKECLDLPDKIYMPPRKVELTKEQLELIRDLKERMQVELAGEKLTVQNTIGWMTRAQQIVGGNYPYKNGDDEWCTRPLDKNPKLDELVELLGELPHGTQSVVWARYRPEISTIAQGLRSLGYVVGELHGGIEPADRTRTVADFQAGACQIIVANQATGGMGLTLTAGTNVVYYSNTFSYEERVQSEDRTHRIGQDSHVTYTDLVSNAGIDRTALQILEKKSDLADFVKNAMIGELI